MCRRRHSHTMLRAAICCCCLLLLPACATAVATPSVSAPPLDQDHAIFAGILAAVVHPDGVDYDHLRRLEPELDRYRSQLAAAPIPDEPQAAMAHWINAYNALTLALVMQVLPDPLPADASVKQVSGFWKRYRFQVGDMTVSLDDIEHRLLRPMGDPRIHFAINCASRSCPPLAAQPYTAAALDEQLNAATQAFAQSPEHLRLEGNRLLLNPLLSWFGSDFAAQGGVAAFLLHYVEDETRRAKLSDNNFGFFRYDWSINRHAE